MVRSAIEKIDEPHDLPKVKCAPIHWGRGLMAIPHPREVLRITKFISCGWDGDS